MRSFYILLTILNWSLLPGHTVWSCLIVADYSQGMRRERPAAVIYKENVGIAWIYRNRIYTGKEYASFDKEIHMYMIIAKSNSSIFKIYACYLPVRMYHIIYRVIIQKSKSRAFSGGGNRGFIIVGGCSHPIPLSETNTRRGLNRRFTVENCFTLFCTTLNKSVTEPHLRLAGRPC